MAGAADVVAGAELVGGVKGAPPGDDGLLDDGLVPFEPGPVPPVGGVKGAPTFDCVCPATPAYPTVLLDV